MDKNQHKYSKKTDALGPLKDQDFVIIKRKNIAKVWYL
jgi:hypothetical protein